MKSMRSEYKTVTATEVKNRFGDYLEKVVSTHHPVIVERHGKPQAVLMDYQEWIRDAKSTELGGSKSTTPCADAYRRLSETIRRRIKKERRPVKQTSSVEIIRQIREEEY